MVCDIHRLLETETVHHKKFVVDAKPCGEALQIEKTVLDMYRKEWTVDFENW